MKKIHSCYYDELETISFHGKHKPMVQFSNGDTSTTWMNVNAESAEVIVLRLIKEFNVNLDELSELLKS